MPICLWMQKRLLVVRLDLPVHRTINDRLSVGTNGDSKLPSRHPRVKPINGMYINTTVEVDTGDGGMSQRQHAGGLRVLGVDI